MAEQKKEFYLRLAEQMQSLTEGVPHLVANLANASALLNEAMEDVNWVGFYLMENGRLVLGPFQGKTARVEIPVGKGVCGTAVERDEVVVVENVHAFPGHIACDCASNAEIVLPIRKDGMVVGVLDMDSPVQGRFTEEDREGLLCLIPVLEQFFQ